MTGIPGRDEALRKHLEWMRDRAGDYDGEYAAQEALDLLAPLVAAQVGPLTVSCPKCEARSGEPCTTGGYLPVGDLDGDERPEGPHRQRRAAVTAQVEQRDAEIARLRNLVVGLRGTAFAIGIERDKLRAERDAALAREVTTRRDALTEAADALDGKTYGGSLMVSKWLRDRAAVESPDRPEGRAEVVTLCGSTRFKDAFHAENQRLTMEGKVVISLGVYGHADLPDYDWTTDASDLKRTLDGLHFQKIDMADRVHVVNVGGYVGESTQREIEYARSRGLLVTFMDETAGAESQVRGGITPFSSRERLDGPPAPAPDQPEGKRP